MEEKEFLQLLVNQNQQIIQRLEGLEKVHSLSLVKESYTTEEVAKRLDRANWTVRQWCNRGQVKAKKVRGRGRQGEWRIPQEELMRLQNDGPLFPSQFDNHNRGQRRAS